MDSLLAASCSTWSLCHLRPNHRNSVRRRVDCRHHRLRQHPAVPPGFFLCVEDSNCEVLRPDCQPRGMGFRPVRAEKAMPGPRSAAARRAEGLPHWAMTMPPHQLFGGRDEACSDPVLTHRFC